LLGGRLKPVPPGDTARISKLVADLSSGSPAVRRKAMMELRARHGEAALGALQQNPNRQQNFRPGMTFQQKLLNLYNTPERARDLKAVRTLEEIATPEARQVLEKLSQGAVGDMPRNERAARWTELTGKSEKAPYRRLAEI
jgi:hypothetical protein